MKCVKCGAAMLGPQWVKHRDELRYSCRCGWCTYTLPNDRRGSVVHAQTCEHITVSDTTGKYCMLCNTRFSSFSDHADTRSNDAYG